MSAVAVDIHETAIADDRHTAHPASERARSDAGAWAVSGALPHEDEILTSVDIARVTNRSTRVVSLWIKQGLVTPVGQKKVVGGVSPTLRWGDVYRMLTSKGLPVVKGRVRCDNAVETPSVAPIDVPVSHADAAAARGEDTSSDVDWSQLKTDIKARLAAAIKNAPTDAMDQGAAQKFAQAVKTLSTELAEIEQREREAEERSRVWIRIDDAQSVVRHVVDQFVVSLNTLEAAIIGQSARRLVADGIASDMDQVQRLMRTVVSQCVIETRAAIAANLKQSADRMAA